jgi:hypothetical protein
LRQAFYFHGKYVKDSGDITALSLCFESEDLTAEDAEGAEKNSQYRLR